MLSLRSCARTILKNSSRQISSKSISKSSLIRQISLSHSTQEPVRFHIAPFSTSASKKDKNVESDVELASKLSSELKMEKEMNDGLESTCVKDYLSNGPFDVIDIPGKEEVILKRTYGKEKIQISFSINDLNLDPEFNDRAFDDDEGEENSDEQKNPEDDYEDDTSLPSRLSIVIEKASKGALLIEAIIQDSCVITENVFYCKDIAHAYAKTPDALQHRNELYLGPPFGNLDETVQVQFERYLDERGINSTLAAFIPEYQTAKEQKEYLKWLENVKGFVDA